MCNGIYYADFRVGRGCLETLMFLGLITLGGLCVYLGSILSNDLRSANKAKPSPARA